MNLPGNNNDINFNLRQRDCKITTLKYIIVVYLFVYLFSIMNLEGYMSNSNTSHIIPQLTLMEWRDYVIHTSNL